VAVRRISIGPGEVAGYFSGLKSGFDELGVPCEHFVLSANKFAYQESAYFLRSVYQAGATLSESKNNGARFIGRLWTRGVRATVFLYALIRCDVFIFSGFSSFLGFRELPLLKFLGKKVIVVFLGSDARPPIFSGRHLDDMGTYVDSSAAYKESKQLVKKIQQVEKYADVIVNHTATSQYFSRPFERFVAVGMPITVRTSAAPVQENQQSAIRILHAPSRPVAKGSLIFRKLIDELKAEGYTIEFIELVGVPNSTVLEELQKCDFVLDELYSDMPLAMFATEAAMFGKPVVVGGYYAVRFKLDNHDCEIPPALFVEPEGIKQAIKKMIVDHDFRLDLGRRAHHFILESWNAHKVAQNYLRLIEGDIPENWIAKPEAMDYCLGWGLSKENWRKQVKEYVEELGEDELMFNHNPKLKKKILDELAQAKAIPLS